MSDSFKKPAELLVEALANWGKISPEEQSKIFAEEAILVDPTQPERLVGKTLQWFKNIEQNFPPFTTKLTFLKELAENVVYYEFIATLYPQGSPPSYLIFRQTTVWKQIEGSWKIILEQWDGNPCDDSGQRLT